MLALAGPGDISASIEAPDVVAVHVLLGATVDDPVGELSAAAAAQHHP